MPKWQIELLGEAFDLEELPRLFTSPEARVIMESERYYLESARLDSREDPEMALKEGSAQVLALNGAARLVYHNFKPVRPGHVRRRDLSEPQTYLFLEGGVELRSKVESAAVVISGQPARLPAPPPSSAWLTKALSSDGAQEALRVLARTPIAWADLYNVIEIVQSNGGAHLVGAVVSQADIDRITQTANSRRAIGDDARHGHRKFEPPKKPIDLADAVQVVHTLVRAWLTGDLPA